MLGFWGGDDCDAAGLQVLDALYAGYGEGAPRGAGPSQGRITAEGAAYLEADFPRLSTILQAEVLAAPGGASPTGPSG